MIEENEALWAGWYGIQYTTKFMVDWHERIPFLGGIAERTQARSVLDIGTNAAWNLRALREVDESLDLQGTEINQHVALTAASMSFEVHVCAARHVSHKFRDAFDLVITSGVLIHVHPDTLAETIESIIAASRRWVLAVEYPADQETVVRRHGETPRAWARPYGRLYEAAGLRLVEHGTPKAGYPECEYWLLKKEEL